jgi:hypothetical protein
VWLPISWPSRYDALHDADVLRGLGADQHEGCLDVLVAQNIENLGRPLGIGSVVEGERDFVGVVAVLLDGVGARINVHVLIDDELLARIELVGFDLDGALAGLGKAGDADDVAVALLVHIVAGLNGARACSASGLVGLSQMLHSELSSSPRRQSAKVCRPMARAARNSFSMETPSRNQTTWRWFKSSSMYSKWG